MTPNFTNWRDYQHAVAQAFTDLGCNAEVDKTIASAAGPQDVDVYVTFRQFGYECRWIVECKLWSSRVPKDAVHTLRSKVLNVGADRGVIFTEVGFQSGARAATQHTNILLQTSLEDFRRTAELYLTRIPLLLKAGDERDAPPIHVFPDSYEPHHLLRHGKRVFVGNWGKPQAGNIAIVDPETRTIEAIIELDKYEDRRMPEGTRTIRQYPPGNIACADGKLFLGQVFSEYVLVIDIDTQSIVKRIPIPGGGEGAIAASPDGRRVYYASNRISRLFAIDTASYEFDAIDYPPGGRGCLCVLPHPSKPILYLGIQRGGRLDGISYPGGNCFLAVYDLEKQRYARDLYLSEVTNGRSDDATPICLTYDEEQRCLYVGMFQSMRGICRIDELGSRILDEFRFEANARNRHFRWVDPLSQAPYRNKLLSVNRNNRELVMFDKTTGRVERSTYLGEAPNGPHSVAVVDDIAIISYPERGGLIFQNLAVDC